MNSIALISDSSGYNAIYGGTTTLGFRLRYRDIRDIHRDISGALEIL